MVKIILCFTMAVALIGCADGQDTFIDQEVQPYLNYLKTQHNWQFDGEISIAFTIGEFKQATSAAAICRTTKRFNKATLRQETVRKIIIKKHMWEHWSDEVRLATLAHELGHCDLGLGHGAENGFLMAGNVGAFLRRYTQEPSLIDIDIVELLGR